MESVTFINDVIKIFGICYSNFHSYDWKWEGLSQSYYKASEGFEYVDNEKLVPFKILDKIFGIK